MSGQQPARSGANLIGEIVGLLARPPSVAGIDIDQSYFKRLQDNVTRSDAQRVLLPADFGWRSPLAATRDAEPPPPLVPLQLCEFLAYKTALAYEPPARIKAFLENSCPGITPENSHFRFFDSAREGAASAGKLADAQGYGFVFERKAFVIFRGTENGKAGEDWAINRIDTLTDKLGGAADRVSRRLRASYGHLLDKLGLPEPGRHVGFSIAWAAVKDEVEDWLAALMEQGAIDKIVYSGHSLGGAMAQIAAFDHARIEDAVGKDRNIRINRIAAVVTFGAPAVGSKEFAAVYRRLLGDRTVLLESSGDLVPRIMERWYYRMLYPLRQRVKAGIQMHLHADDAYGKVAKPWTFVSEPPLSDAEISLVLSSIRDAGTKLVEKAEEKQRKEAAEKAKRDKASSEPSAPGQSKRGEDGSSNASSTATSSGAKPVAEPTPSWVYWVVGGVFVIAAAGVAWYFVRRKLFSHDIEQRYALYLSTLSYQQLRAKHGGDLKLANAELADHLRFVRGDVTRAKEFAAGKPFYSSVQGLPLALEIRDDPAFVDFLKRSETFV